MGAAQARGERDRQAARDVAVVDEVVLGDGEALPGTVRRTVDASLEVEEDGAWLLKEKIIRRWDSDIAPMVG